MGAISKVGTGNGSFLNFLKAVQDKHNRCVRMVNWFSKEHFTIWVRRGADVGTWDLGATDFFLGPWSN